MEHHPDGFRLELRREPPPLLLSHVPTCAKKLRTLAVLELEVDLTDPQEEPVYQRIAAEALESRELGWTMGEIGRRFRIDPQTAKKAVVCALEGAGRSMSAPTNRSSRGSRHAQLAAKARLLQAEGLSLSAHRWTLRWPQNRGCAVRWLATSEADGVTPLHRAFGRRSQVRTLAGAPEFGS